MGGKLILREDYWSEGPARAAFKSFIETIHGLDFTRWEECGYWDRSYRPFTYFDAEGAVAASVCLYTMELTVEGRSCTAAQISGVGTRPELRRRGLNRELTERALAWAADEHEFTFLFSDEDAIPFYERLGFQAAPESRPSVRIEGGGEDRPGLRRLDLGQRADRELAWTYARRRAPVSERLGVRNARLFMFHALYTLRESLYHLPELDVLVAFVRSGEHLELRDVVGERVPRLAELLPWLATEETREVRFAFMPDKLGVEGVAWRPYLDNATHDRGDIPLRGEPYLFPFSAHA